jgi:hypothetical protein
MKPSFNIDDIIAIQDASPPIISRIDVPIWVFQCLRSKLPQDNNIIPPIYGVEIKVNEWLTEWVVKYYIDGSYEVVHIGKENDKN